ncbi:hypothetical protein ACP4OV_022874 [Aristida adscensionis]
MDKSYAGFFKFMMGDFRNGVAIPKKFATNIRAPISEEVKLEVPNGEIYSVKFAKEQDNLVIRSGWETFAGAYDLNQGDLLVFTYSGHSHFKVQIFDPSGCEKGLSCVPITNIPCVQLRSVSHSDHTQPPTDKRLAEHNIGSQSDRRKTSKANPRDSPSQRTIEDVPSSEGIQEPKHSGGFKKSTKSCIIIPKGYSMTSDHKAKVAALKQKIQPKIPFYVTVMHRQTMASGYLDISKDYAAKYLSDNNGAITIGRLYGSKTWAISLDTSTDGRHANSTGWLDFISDNMLEDGDICIFELSKGKGGMTWIFHPLNERCRLSPPGYVPSGKRPRHPVSEPGYIAPRFTTLSSRLKSEVRKKILAIQLEIPVHLTIMQNNNINRSPILEFSSVYARQYLPRARQTIRLKLPGMDDIWEGMLLVRAGRHALTRVWKQFVDDNKLKLGDICLFQKMKDKELTMTVHIIRA